MNEILVIIFAIPMLVFWLLVKDEIIKNDRWN